MLQLNAISGVICVFALLQLLFHNFKLINYSFFVSKHFPTAVSLQLLVLIAFTVNTKAFLHTVKAVIVVITLISLNLDCEL